jgi:hypothetical protein
VTDAAPPLYRATVPVFIAVLDRLEATLDKAEAQLGDRFAAALDQRPAEGMRPAGQQLAMAVQFALRVACGLAGQRAPEPRDALDGPGLRARLAAARAHLRALPPEAFAGAEHRPVRIQAGFADLELTGEAFLHEFGLPNLYFHHALTHVALKQAGARLGKADYDAKHDYPEQFSFG